MPRVLYIEVSPRKAVSASSAAAKSFLDGISEVSGVTVDTLDLWGANLPEFDGAMIDAKYARLAGRTLDEREAKAWQRITMIVDRLKAADVLVIATPMWNFGIPYKLKHWIDLITQPGLTFSFNPASGYAPLLDPKPVVVILASAGDYRRERSRGRPDLASPYLLEALKFIGLTEVTIVPVAPTVGSQLETAAALDNAKSALASLVANFKRYAA